MSDRDGRPGRFVPLDTVFAAYDHWATWVEQMGGREKRNKTDFKADLMAALTERGSATTGGAGAIERPG